MYIIVFDGACILCNSAVAFLHKRLQYKDYNFIPSQSDIGKECLAKYNLIDISRESIILIKNEAIYTKSDAILEIVKDMTIFWRLLNISRILPKIFRDWFYDVISRNRHWLLSEKK